MTTPRTETRFTFANAANAKFIQDTYEQYLNDPSSVDASWKMFFEGYEFATSQGLEGSARGAGGGQPVEFEARVEAFINLYRRLGHLNADLNPLQPSPALASNLQPSAHGLAQVTNDQQFHPANLPVQGPLRFQDIWDLLKDTYCRKIGADFREINAVEPIVWLQEQMESVRNRPSFTKAEKLRAFDKLVRAEGFERFLQDRFLGQKRFSVEGLDALVPLMDLIASEAVSQNVEELNIGMAHRGRLNTLTNFMGKPFELMFKEFEDSEYHSFDIDGDVKYHKGFASNIPTLNGKSVRAYLSPNPSHLEVVNPVVEGFARARQNMLNDKDRQRVLPILIHGDASFIGQGLVAETLNLSELESYKTGGTIHIITNNQVGFTTNPDESRSCTYSSDIAKMVRAPVFHVNADDPEAVLWTGRLAFAYRQKFKKDVVIDLVGYRRHGHNETDEPGYTQPQMYNIIRTHPTVLKKYGDQLVSEGVLTAAEVEAKIADFRKFLQDSLDRVRKGNLEILVTIPKELEPSMRYVKATPEDLFKKVKTGVAAKTLSAVADKFTTVPKGFTPHPKIEKLLQQRQKMLEGDGSIDWGMAELLAYGSLAVEGKPVRLSGQDCRRGTFSHRHAVIVDYENGKSLNLLGQLSPDQAEVEIINSPLSEQGVMGFEFGFSVANRDALVMWEAQFGDFVNGAQIIIDQFLVSCEAKWKQNCGLVLMLPHGHEGMGPEHSSGRPERFLQLCGNWNIQVANVTTPAQFFHILRRQLMREFRKPLVIMTPKSLLRHPKVVSTTKELSQGQFTEVINDQTITQAKAVERVLFCTGKIFYDLDKAREDAGVKNTAIVRIEQLYPFAQDEVAAILKQYGQAKKICWVQEEPVNMGAWTYMRPILEELLGEDKKLEYVGRKGAGTPAEGSQSQHKREQERIVQEALGLTQAIKSKKESMG